jgi:hypothetical protein
MCKTFIFILLTNREAYHESVRMGNELTKRMSEEIGAVEENEDQLFDEDSQRPVTEMAAEELVMVFQNEADQDDSKISGKYSKLFEMDFMKKAKEQQKERAIEQAKEVLKEIEMAEEDDNESEQIRNDKSQIDSRNNTQGNDDIVGHSYSAVHTIDEVKKEIANGFDARNGFQITKSNSTKVPNDGKVATTTNVYGQSNPWLQNEGTVEVKVDKFEVEQGSQSFSFELGKKRRIDTSRKEDANYNIGNTSTKEILLTKSSQEELMHTAFAGLNYEEEFLLHKKEEVDRELGLDEKKMKVLKDGKGNVVFFFSFFLLWLLFCINYC